MAIIKTMLEPMMMFSHYHKFSKNKKTKKNRNRKLQIKLNVVLYSGYEEISLLFLRFFDLH